MNAAVMDWDSHRYLECFFAVPMIGAVLHTVNVRLSPEQILYTIDHAEDDVLLVNAEFLPIIEQIKGRIDTVSQYVLLNDEQSQPETHLKLAGEYENLLATGSPHCEFADFDENTRATTFYTTGTTGMPKGVYFSHRQLVLHTLGVLAALGTPGTQGRFHQQDVYMPITPMFHVHAWGLPYVATALGVKQVYPGRYAPEMLLDLIDREQVTFSHCVPTILHMLFKSPRIDQIDLSRWKMIIGGSALPRTLCLEAMKRGIDIFTGYGMSETCPILTLSHLTAEMLEQGPEEQAIVVRAPWLTQGYLKDQKNSEKLWSGGYLHTGDVAVRDARGYVRITDRTKDVIKIGGEWVSSLELEDIVAHHEAVSEVAVIGAPDDKWGERPLALVVLKPQGAGVVSEKSLVAYIKGYAEKGIVSKQVLLTRVRFVEAIDKTSVGKVNKLALRQKYL